MPIHTVETRWFADGSLPAAVEEWFRDLGPTGPSSWETREDAYLVVPESTEMGVKARGESDALEVKCRSATFGVRPFGDSHSGVVEGWIKWSHPAGSEWISTLTRRFPGVQRVWKSRLKRYYLIEGPSDWTEVPVAGAVERGAIVEVAKLRKGGAEYHSIAVEAFPADGHPAGRPAELLADHVATALSKLLADIPARLSAESSMAYPEWLTGAREK